MKQNRLKNMKRFPFFSVIVFLSLLAACAKTASNNSSANSATSLWPLKAGNSWVYTDSIFDNNGNLLNAYNDSTFISSKTTTKNGINFYAYNDSLGWFGADGYVAVDASNTTLYGLDSLNATSPYLFFATVPYDGYVIGSSQDFSNPSCIGTDALYGFASTYTVKGYTCYKTLEDVKDCNGNIIYADVYYISPGVGIVRIEEYSAVPNSTSNALYLDYSQTLGKDKIN